MARGAALGPPGHVHGSGFAARQYPTRPDRIANGAPHHSVCVCVSVWWVVYVHMRVCVRARVCCRPEPFCLSPTSPHAPNEKERCACMLVCASSVQWRPFLLAAATTAKMPTARARRSEGDGSDLFNRGWGLWLSHHHQCAAYFTRQLEQIR